MNVGGIKHLFEFHITQQIVSLFKVSMVIPPDTATIWWNRGCRMVFQVNQKSKMIRFGKLGNDRTCGKAVEIIDTKTRSIREGCPLGEKWVGESTT